MLCKILIINMLDYKFKRFIFNMVLILISCTKEIRLFLSLILMMYMVDIYMIISYMINLSFFLRSLKKRLEKEAFGLYLSI